MASSSLKELKTSTARCVYASFAFTKLSGTLLRSQPSAVPL